MCPDLVNHVAPVERLAVAFARALREAGLPVAIDSVTAFVRALGELGVDRREAVYWSGRATMVRDRDAVTIYDSVFDEFWSGSTAERAADEPAPASLLDESWADDGDDLTDAARAGEVVEMRYSPVEVLGRKDFAAYTADELDEAHRLMADLRLVAVRRRSRRRRAVRRRTGRPDLRHSARAALRTGGEPVRLVRTEPRMRPRRIVLLCDVSGSMEPYARALLRFVQAAVSSSTRVEAFTLGTRLTRVTQELRSHDPDAALAAASEAVRDWSGGTRLGEGLEAFNTGWGHRGMARGAVVVILSDGWDRGDPTHLAEQMARLRRVAHRVVWVNPLKASPGYEPVAAGMAAALPHVDELVEGHSLDSLHQLAELIAR